MVCLSLIVLIIFIFNELLAQVLIVWMTQNRYLNMFGFNVVYSRFLYWSIQYFEDRKINWKINSKIVVQIANMQMVRCIL